jgi:membrane protein YdbS with pleckstrin-like domain
MREGRMNYIGRPAWRNHWLGITVVVLLILVSVLVLILPEETAEFDYDIIAGILLAGAAIIALSILYRRYSWKFTITTELIESRHGIIARDVESIRVKDLRNVNLRQSFLKRIFGVGDLEFSSAGGAGIEVMFHGITKAMKIKQQVQAMQGDL